MTRLVVISGCSSGGKSTLIDELARRGHGTVPEPGRRVVREELASGGTALPWVDTTAFVDRIVTLAMADYEAAASHTGWTFIDRGLVDALSARATVNGTAFPRERMAGYQYYRRVFLAPPWPEIYVTDGERQHGLAEAEREYERLLTLYPALGYEVVLLPKVPVAERADFVERLLEAP